ncbi:maleylpyruvate isomerase family protein [Hymenobacter busanensis]|uniref:Maleylpyruvate isomerase family protein n=1 Tax=Hymenobacter busanensis TaxID=2607656 RepID=A0A7L4ZTV6_9BACT|nr:maleylpyruvate isomerase N-terminal domain-containing protein [Hymenobacter busanensis]KAA9339840.1 maleylpyruvate isomerase family protein [Hymenobacter busanensis]QHJ06407.1 hypothetical protein GUY19_03465 [Hymenobacter busanensis]
MSRPVPIETLDLFPEVDALLIEFLRGLTPDEWQRPTLAPRWTVLDVALHLLDGNLRTLSMLRDGYFGVQPPATANTYAGLVDFLNTLNADWLTATRRLSPGIATWLLELTGREYSAFLRKLDPWAPAAFPVGWAGESESLNWFHVAREYTEKWHHQQQVRQAVGRGETVLLQPRLYRPYVETSMRALPHQYRHVLAPQGTVLRVVIGSPELYAGYLHRKAETWELGDVVDQPTASVEIDAAVAWRLFSKQLSRAEAEKHVRVTGPVGLAEAIFDMVAVMV